MTEKEMKKLSRYQLLELLIQQTNKVDELQKLLDEANLKLEEQEIQLKEFGSISEISTQLIEILETAKTTTDYYINDAQKRAAVMEAHAREEAGRILVNARNEAQKITEQIWTSMEI